MSRNLIIKSSTYVLWATLSLMVIVLLTLPAFVVHWHLDKSFYDNFYLVSGFLAGLNSFNVTLSLEPHPGISLGKLSSGMVIWLAVRSAAIVLVGMYSVKIMLGIFNSIKNLETFYEGNIRAFKKLVNLGLIVSAIATFNFGIVNDETMWNFAIPFRPLIYTSFCLVMSEVFKEGRNLLEESRTII